MSRFPKTSSTRWKKWVYAFSFLDEFIPLYAIHVLWFADAGLTTGEISLLLMVWAGTSFLMEIPSGILGDLISRRYMLTIAVLLRAAGFSLWILFPVFPVFALGFALWGIKGAFTSGVWQALIYDRLRADGRTDEYTPISARVEAVKAIANVGGLLVAPLLLLAGGYSSAAWFSVAMCAVSVPCIWLIPETPLAREPAGTRTAELAEMLRTAYAEARHNPQVSKLLIICAGLTGLGSFDEYFPLLASASGIETVLVPLVVGIPTAAIVLGSEVAARQPRVRARRVSVVLAAGAVALVFGALLQHPVGFVGIGLFYGALKYATVIGDARLQDSLDSSVRATVTSVAGFGSEVVVVLIHGVVGFGTLWLSISEMSALLAIPPLLIALLILRWLPAPRAVPQAVEIS